MALARAVERNSTLEKLNLRNNNLYDESAELFCLALKASRNLVRLNLERNNLKHRFMLEVDKCCRRNRACTKNKDIPAFKRQVADLVRAQDR